MNSDRVGLSTARLYTEPVCVFDLYALLRSKARDWDLPIYRLCQTRYDYFSAWEGSASRRVYQKVMRKLVRVYENEGLTPDEIQNILVGL